MTDQQWANSGATMTADELAIWEREARAGRLHRRIKVERDNWTAWLEGEAVRYAARQMTMGLQ